MAGKGIDFGRHPSFSQAALQVRHHQKSHIPGALFDLCHAETLALCSPLTGVIKHAVPCILQGMHSIHSSYQTKASCLYLLIV